MSDGLLVAMDDESSLIIYLSNGRVTVTFDPTNGGFSAVTTTSIDAYSDSQQHHVRVVFDDGRLSLTVDENQVTSIDSKKNSINDNYKNYLLVFFVLAFGHTYIQPDTIWFGGANITFPSNIPAESINALRGCMYNIAFSNTGILQLVDTTKATVQQ